MTPFQTLGAVALLLAVTYVLYERLGTGAWPKGLSAFAAGLAAALGLALLVRKRPAAAPPPPARIEPVVGEARVVLDEHAEAQHDRVDAALTSSNREQELADLTNARRR